MILAHADHPEMFFAGLLVGAMLVLAQIAYREFKERSKR